jgi:hypothetical protein
VLDIGCGDGRALVEAARVGARSEGYEIDDARAAEACQAVAAARAAAAAQDRPFPLVRVHAINAIEVIDTALEDGVTLVFMYLTPPGLLKVLKYLRQASRPLKVITYVYPLREPASRGGALLPCRKIWCAPDDAWQREQGVKFPIHIYSFSAVTQFASTRPTAAAAAAPAAPAQLPQPGR